MDVGKIAENLVKGEAPSLIGFGFLRRWQCQVLLRSTCRGFDKLMLALGYDSCDASSDVYYAMEHSKPGVFAKSQQYSKLWNHMLGPVVLKSAYERGGHFAAWERPDAIVADLGHVCEEGGFGVLNWILYDVQMEFGPGYLDTGCADVGIHGFFTSRCHHESSPADASLRLAVEFQAADKHHHGAQEADEEHARKRRLIHSFFADSAMCKSIATAVLADA
ncbi:hypothetical protein B0I35DRAFT_495163 [Stachybotrys elegans]|uniref:Uncharacterized protein n=1 Tax=Stachybotrys elegans TaxID=80388 RepID=A0A8K0SDB6_9HYPO|nr:hypothetical protein B0I35DRAFT_495163 [Stachybotrys elegans]